MDVAIKMATNWPGHYNFDVTVKNKAKSYLKELNWQDILIGSMCVS